MILWRDIIKRKRRIIDIRKKGEEKMKKRFFALLTAVCIALTTGLTTGLTALADGGENSDMTIGMSTAPVLPSVQRVTSTLTVRFVGQRVRI